jgi:hypothetical protein
MDDRGMTNRELSASANVPNHRQIPLDALSDFVVRRLMRSQELG